MTSVCVVLTTTPASIAAERDAAIAEQLNAFLRRFGLHLSTAATQLHVVPETVYAVPDKVTALLSRHAEVLVSHPNVRCDFSALSGVLWARIKEAEDQIDAFLQETQGTSSEGRYAASASRVVHHLVVLAQALHTLRHADEPCARPEVREAVPVVQKDVEMTVRISSKAVRVLEGAVAKLHEVDVHFVRAAELLLASAEVYLATIAARPAIDVTPLLSFIYGKPTWRLSGVGINATESYCMAVNRLVRALFARQWDFSNVERTAAGLLLQRLADRPPFTEHTFRALHVNRDEPATAACGLLCVMSAVLLHVEDLLLADTPWAPALRRECASLLRAMNTRKQLLSYFQVPVLAVLQGMPPVDLADDAELMNRARATSLIADPSYSYSSSCSCSSPSSAPEGVALCAAPRPALLRVLFAHGFAASSSGAAHSALSHQSAVALARSFVSELLQLPQLLHCGSSGKGSSGKESSGKESSGKESSGKENSGKESSGKESSGKEKAAAAVGLDALRLRPPVLAGRIAQLVADAAVASGAAADVLKELHSVAGAAFAASAAQCASRLSAERVDPRVRRFVVAAADLLARFFLHIPSSSESNHSHHHRNNNNNNNNNNHNHHNYGGCDFAAAAESPCLSLEAAARVYALHAFYASAAKIAPRRIAALAARLAEMAQAMPRAALSSAFCTLLLPCAEADFMSRRNLQEYALLEAYTRAFATAGAALAMDESVMLRHWADVARRCATNTMSGALAMSGLDLLCAAFHSRRTIAPLFAPMYVALLVPVAVRPRYGEPPLLLVRHFAKGVRSVCQALEECDAEALAQRLNDSASAVAKFVAESSASGSGSGAVSLDHVQPIGSVLLIVSALFDKVSALLMGHGERGVARKERHARFQAYFSGLINLLRCRVNTVLHRVCASIEAVVLEHLHDVPTAQAQWMKYIGATIDEVRGNSKNCVAEWFLRLNEKMNGKIGRSHL